MKFELCKIFGVQENQHFWIKEMYGREIQGIWEYFIRDNNIFIINNGEADYCDNFDLMKVIEIYYEKPIELDNKTRQFLRLIELNYNRIKRVSNNNYSLIDDFTKDVFSLNDIEKCFDIDLSMLEIGKEYVISDLLREK